MLLKMYRHQLVVGKMSLSDKFSIAILYKTFSRHEYIVGAIRNVLGYGASDVVTVCGLLYFTIFANIDKYPPQFCPSTPYGYVQLMILSA